MKLRLASASSPPPDLSPERVALAEAIERHTAAVAGIAKLDAGLQVADEKASAARAALEAAEKALEEAPANATKWLVADAIGDDPGPPVDLAAYRAAVADRKEKADLAKEAAARISAALGTARHDAEWTSKHVHTAAVAVIKTAPRIARLIEEIQALQARVVDRGRELSEYVGLLSRHDADAVHARAVDNLFYLPPASWLDVMKACGPSNTWKVALEALKRDATAPLPE